MIPVTATTRTATDIEADAIVLGIEQDRALRGATAAVDAATGGLISRLISHGEASGKCLALTTVLAPSGIKAAQIVLVGLGQPKGDDGALAYKSAAAAAKLLAAKPRKSVAYYLDVAPKSLAIAGAINGCVGQDLYRAEKKLMPFEQILWADVDERSLKEGSIIGHAIQQTRRWINEPANQIFPESLAAECQRLGKTCGFEVEVWDEKRLQQERCGALLAVSAGSDQPPRLVIMRYRGGSASRAPLGLVGKGVTFDSGGLSLKTSESMVDMKCDMAGAATVMGAMQAIAQLKLPTNVTGLIGCVENMVSGRSFKLGDVLTARNGRTIEVLNTDAEGRLVLADVLDVARQEKCSHLVDLATLTGACVVALGRYVAGVMTNSQPWCDSVLAAARHAGEDAWQLPMFADYDEQIKSEVADIKNIGDGRWGGAITAAKFLEQFVGDTPWTHIDIAGPSFLERPLAWVDAGASGSQVRTLIRLAAEFGAES